MTLYRWIGNPKNAIPEDFALTAAEAVDPGTGESFAALYEHTGAGLPNLYGWEEWTGPHTLSPEEAE